VPEKDRATVPRLPTNHTCGTAVSPTRLPRSHYTEIHVAQLDRGVASHVAIGAGLSASRLSFGGSTVYWSGTYRVNSAAHDIAAVACTGSDCDVIPTTYGVLSFAGDSEGIFWVEGNDEDAGGFNASTIHAANLDGADRRVVESPVEQPYHMALGPDRVYYSSHGLRSALRDGGVSTLIVPDELIEGLTVATIISAALVPSSRRGCHQAWATSWMAASSCAVMRSTSFRSGHQKPPPFLVRRSRTSTRMPQRRSHSIASWRNGNAATSGWILTIRGLF
jgi:hypothetical protein